MKKLLTTLALIAAPFIAHADGGIYAGGWSKHLNGGAYNETHEAYLIEYDGFMGGKFTNSYGRESYLAAYSWEAYEAYDFKVGIIGGFIHGYTKQNLGELDYLYLGNDWMVGAAPFIRWEAYSVQPQVSLLGQAVVLNIRYSFN
jgi:hypothetical protein